MHWYIFRHGQTIFSKYHLPYSIFNQVAGILPEGRRQAIKIAQELKVFAPEAFFTSPLKRCRQTAEIIHQETGLTFIEDFRIREQEITFGKETLADLEKRMQEFVDEVKQNKYTKVAVCSHGWPTAVLCALLNGRPVNHAQLAYYPQTGEIVKIQI